MPALLPLFIQVMPELFKLAKDVPVVLDYIHKSKETFQAEGEWSPEAEAVFTKELEDLKANPPDWWKPEGE
jgi:hypothetical protein